jgi:hypothetical protein
VWLADLEGQMGGEPEAREVAAPAEWREAA